MCAVVSHAARVAIRHRSVFDLLVSVTAAVVLGAVGLAALLHVVQRALASRYWDTLAATASAMGAPSPHVSRAGSATPMPPTPTSEFSSPVADVCTLLRREAKRELSLLADLEDLGDDDRDAMEKWTPAPGDGETQLRECVAELKSLRKRVQARK